MYEKFVSRIWAKDASLWSSDPAAQKEIGARLDWLDVLPRMTAQIGDLRAFAKECKDAGMTDALLLGMGGSSLCPDVFRKVFCARPDALRMHVLDSTDPDQIAQIERELDLTKTIILVASKSGSTLEIQCLYEYFRFRQPSGDHFVAITDPGTKLEKLAREAGFRRTFINPPDIGGRYSALSLFGLVPAALMGVEIDQILASASQAATNCKSETLETNAGLTLGALLGEAAIKGRDKLTILTTTALAPLGAWIEQLVAESSGKMGKGIVPIDGEPPLPLKAYGSDRVFVAIALKSEVTSAWRARLQEIAEAGHPVIQFNLETLHDLGGQFFTWEFATALACAILKVDAFDQPNVEEAKVKARDALEAFEKSERLSAGTPIVTEASFELFASGESFTKRDFASIAAALEAFVENAKKSSYVAALGFLPMDQKIEGLLQEVRRALSTRTQKPTTAGFGPRYLHSTGQLHKGGPKSAAFLMLTADKTRALEIPGRPYSFETLQLAQALGDFDALAGKGLPVFRIHLKPPLEKSLTQLTLWLRAEDR